VAYRSVGYLGTSRKRVSFSEYSEQFDFLPSDHTSDNEDDAASVESITEEELLARQGEG
jgi:hypothetical protein